MFKHIIPLVYSPTHFAFICLLLFGISACSSNSNPVVYYESFDFSQVKNYSFYSNDSSFFNSQSLDYAQRNRIELAIEKSLNTQGFTYSELNQADIIITYHLIDKKYKDYKTYNKIVRFCTHCLIANSWKKNNDAWNVYPDGLIIDLINPKTNRSVWRSIYSLDNNVKDNSPKINEKIIAAVEAMLIQYPK